MNNQQLEIQRLKQQRELFTQTCINHPGCINCPMCNENGTNEEYDGVVCHTGIVNYNNVKENT